MDHQTQAPAEFGEAERHRALSRQKTADFIGVSIPTLERWSQQGYGPRPIKIGPRRIIYRLGDLIDFMEQQRNNAA